MADEAAKAMSAQTALCATWNVQWCVKRAVMGPAKTPC
jgi:hypothetical protein